MYGGCQIRIDRVRPQFQDLILPCGDITLESERSCSSAVWLSLMMYIPRVDVRHWSLLSALNKGFLFEGVEQSLAITTMESTLNLNAWFRCLWRT